MRKFHISLIKADRKLIATYTDRELELLLEKPDLKKCSFAEYRDWVAVNYFIGTGNRLKTARFLRIKDLDFENMLINLTTVKNRKQHIIPLTPSLAQVLLEYLAHREGNEDDYVFCDMYGRQLTKDQFTHSIRRYNLRRGVNKTSIHVFRHTFAKKFIKAGGDIFRLQKILGHSSLDMVKVYTEMFSEDLKENFEVFNPLEKFKHVNDIKKINMRSNLTKKRL